MDISSYGSNAYRVTLDNGSHFVIRQSVKSASQVSLVIERAGYETPFSITPVSPTQIEVI